MHHASYIMYHASCIMHDPKKTTLKMKTTSKMLSGVQTGNGIPQDRYNIHGIAHERTNKKVDIFMQRRLEQIFICIFECKKSTPYPARAYTTLVLLVSILP